MTEVSDPNPLATAPLSVVLLVQGAAAELDDAVAGWLEFLRGLGRPFELILVDGAGADAVASLLDQLALRFAEIRIIHHATAQGLGACLRAGLAQAQHPLIFYTLCTQQYRPADLSKLLEQIVQVEVVAGCRVGGTPPWWLRIVDLAHRWFCRLVFGLPVEPRPGWLGWTTFRHRLIVRWLFGLRFHDPECTFCLFRREVFQRLPIQANGSFAPVEILAKANFLVQTGAEVPISFVPDHGPSVSKDPSFFHEALQVFRHPDFSATHAPQPAGPEAVPPPEALPPAAGEPAPLGDSKPPEP